MISLMRRLSQSASRLYRVHLHFTKKTTMKQSKVMPTKATPAHPGERIADDLEELGLSVAVAAKALGISRQQLHNVIAARAGVTPEMALRLEKALGSAAQKWLAMQSEYNLAQVRRAAIKVSALRRARAKRA